MTFGFNDARGGRNFSQMLENYPGLSLSNMGAVSVGSANTGGLTTGTTLAQDLAGTDIVVVWMGDNDIYAIQTGDPLYVNGIGNPTDNASGLSFYGWVNNFLSVIFTAKPTIQVRFISHYLTSHYTQAQYQQIETVLTTAGKAYGVKTMPMLSLSEINQFNWSVMLADTVHPTATPGWSSLAPIIARNF